MLLRGVAQGIECVRKKIDKNLFELRTVAEHETIRFRQAQIDRIVDETLMQQGGGVMQRLLEADRTIRRDVFLRFSGKSFQLPGDVAHAGGNVGDGAEILIDPLPFLLSQKSAGIGCQRPQGGERLADFMRNLGRHLAEHRQLVGLQQRFLGVLARFHFTSQFGVGGAKFPGSMGNGDFQFVMSQLQGVARLQKLPEGLAPVVEIQGQQAEKCQRGQRSR